MNFRYKLMQFMSGRYGVDGMFYGLFGAALVLSLVNCFVRSVAVQLIVYAVMVYAIFRMFSRNINARRAENQKVMQLFGGVKRRMDTMRQRQADKTHIYKKCPGCHAVLRLPRRKGKHTTVCPKCGKSFSVHVYK